ncbi:hypothetical protein DC3_58280 [Deinococcus cellulosilyticus NBRC 106333 = KACC 11606]|uniref:Uncharacterized protein n=1 Tax=Deinococcus cellulosilyticus (strain DSM 18568 / NBRC 106333 / KACC 11606 / 5516J-15) TaxID=1223518 RepID=A0A511NBN8_DEIC1|nr:hypothetical protein DC3_58280 [Deinococcus cellulosilyticus NBRC 106333 = KACC 11606]
MVERDVHLHLFCNPTPETLQNSGGCVHVNALIKGGLDAPHSS